MANFRESTMRVSDLREIKVMVDKFPKIFINEDCYVHPVFFSSFDTFVLGSNLSFEYPTISLGYVGRFILMYPFIKDSIFSIDKQNRNSLVLTSESRLISVFSNPDLIELSSKLKGITKLPGNIKVPELTFFIGLNYVNSEGFRDEKTKMVSRIHEKHIAISPFEYTGKMNFLAPSIKERDKRLKELLNEELNNEDFSLLHENIFNVSVHEALEDDLIEKSKTYAASLPAGQNY